MITACRAPPTLLQLRGASTRSAGSLWASRSFRHSPAPSAKAPSSRSPPLTAAAASNSAAGAAEMVQVIESERTSRQGSKLFTLTTLPDSPPVAVVCWHHGLAEHIGRYKDVFERLAASGIAVYSGDMVGHGKSEGRRVYIESLNDAVDEFLALCDFAAADVKARYPGASPPFFIAGHSLGGLIAALACHRDQGRWAGLILCSAALDVEWTLTLRIQAALGNVLSALIPRVCLVPPVDPNHMNPDPKLVEEYKNDPLNTIGPLPVRTGNEISKAMTWLRKRWREFTLPLYVHHGETDKCTSVPASKAFVEAAASPDKQLYLVPGGYHEVLMNPALAGDLTDRISSWIKGHLAASASVPAPGGGAGQAAAVGAAGEGASGAAKM